MAINLEADAKQGLAVSEEQLSELASLAERQLALEEDKEKLERLLKEVNEHIQIVSEQEIPNKMFECGMSEFKLTNGRKITVKKFYSAKIGDDNRKEAFAWLHSKGFSDIIKHNIEIPLQKGSDSEATLIADFLDKQGIDYVDAETVHPQTLKAFVKEQVEAGSDLPLETFKVYIGNKSIIK